MAIALRTSGTQPVAATNCDTTISTISDDCLIGGWSSDNSTHGTYTFESPFSTAEVDNTQSWNGQSFVGSLGIETSSDTVKRLTDSTNAYVGLVAAFSGVDTTTPRDTTTQTASSGAGTASQTATLTFTTATANAMVVFLVAWDEDQGVSPTLTLNDGGAGLTWSSINSLESASPFRNVKLYYAIKPTAGSISVYVSRGATGGYGCAMLALRPASSLPVITAQPTNQTGYVGLTATFSVTAV